MRISLIAAMDCNYLIGANGKLPWGKLPADMSYFKRKTMGKPVIMGRKTFESIGEPLSGRKNIVLTQDHSFHPSGVHITHSRHDALEKAYNTRDTDTDEIMIIGGASVYRLFILCADRLYLTFIRWEFSGDTFFPFTEMDTYSADEKTDIFVRDWEEKESETLRLEADRDNPYDMLFQVFERREGSNTVH